MSKRLFDCSGCNVSIRNITLNFTRCKYCNFYFCKTCVASSFHGYWDSSLCKNCSECSTCGKLLPKSQIKKCKGDNCRSTFCSSCSYKCNFCENEMCRECAKEELVACTTDGITMRCVSCGDEEYDYYFEYS